MKPNRVNIKHHDKGVITWGVDTSTWMPSITERGWGNGYIAIPVDHPWLTEVKKKYKQRIIQQIQDMSDEFDGRSLYIQDESYYMIPGIEGQEWTYGQREEIDDKSYWVFGFDTLHSWNNKTNSSEDIVMSTIEGYVSVVNNSLT